jgi:GNAT superfamily N-acetyltransferase
MVHVPERLRRQGIGSAMYKYARHELGLDIVPSDSQTADGRAFWNKIHENITEAFDNPYAYNWSRGDHGDYDVFVKLPDGSPLNIAFNHEGDDGWHVAFDRGHSQEVTGEGDAQRIFATVLHAIQQFIGKEHPDKVYFSASKKVEPGQNSESRANLYSRMVKRYASALGYDAVIDDFGRDSVMYILNKKQTVAEKVNPEMAEKDFHAEKDIDILDVGTLKLVAHGMDTDYPHQFMVEVINQEGKKVGHFRFVMMKYNPEKRNMFGFKVANKEDPYVIGGNVSVWDEYQKKGIATEVYRFVKELGNDIRPSTTQSPAGKAMWKSFDRKQDVAENFADGKVKGKSRPGRVKRAGASCNGSVTDLRARAKNASGEKAKMYHWCANMKSGRNK